MSHTRRALALIALLIVPALAQAQQAAATFEQLQVLVKPGDTLWITDMSGTEFTGRLLGISHDAIEVEVAEESRRLTASEVQRIVQRHADPVTNGLLIGAGVGGGLAAVGIAVACAQEDASCRGDGPVIALGIAIWAVLGAGIGAIVDVLHKSKREVYLAPMPAREPALSAGPIIGGDRRGVWLTLRF